MSKYEQNFSRIPSLSNHLPNFVHTTRLMKLTGCHLCCIEGVYQYQLWICIGEGLLPRGYHVQLRRCLVATYPDDLLCSGSVEAQLQCEPRSAGHGPRAATARWRQCYREMVQISVGRRSARASLCNECIVGGVRGVSRGGLCARANGGGGLYGDGGRGVPPSLGSPGHATLFPLSHRTTEPTFAVLSLDQSPVLKTVNLRSPKLVILIFYKLLRKSVHKVG